MLLVDDHEVVLEGLQHMLEGEDDIEVVCGVTSAAEALNKVSVFRPDIILADIKMPGMDGVDFTRKIKERSLRCHVVMLTLFDEYLSLAMDAGASGYLLKDITRGDLIDAIRRAHSGEIVIADAVLRRTHSEYERRGQSGSEEAGLPEYETDKLVSVVVLVLDAPSDAARLMGFVSQAAGALDSTVHRLVGSWKGSTAITFPMPSPTPLDSIIEKLRNISDTESVTEISSTQEIAPNLLGGSTSAQLRNEPTRILHVELRATEPTASENDDGRR